MKNTTNRDWLSSDLKLVNYPPFYGGDTSTYYILVIR